MHACNPVFVSIYCCFFMGWQRLHQIKPCRRCEKPVSASRERMTGEELMHEVMCVACPASEGVYCWLHSSSGEGVLLLSAGTMQGSHPSSPRLACSGANSIHYLPPHHHDWGGQANRWGEYDAEGVPEARRQHYFSTIEKCFSFTIFQYKHQHKPNFSISEHGVYLAICSSTSLINLIENTACLWAMYDCYLT